MFRSGFEGLMTPSHYADSCRNNAKVFGRPLVLAKTVGIFEFDDLSWPHYSLYRKFFFSDTVNPHKATFFENLHRENEIVCSYVACRLSIHFDGRLPAPFTDIC